MKIICNKTCCCGPYKALLYWLLHKLFHYIINVRFLKNPIQQFASCNVMTRLVVYMTSHLGKLLVGTCTVITLIRVHYIIGLHYRVTCCV